MEKKCLQLNKCLYNISKGVIWFSSKMFFLFKIKIIILERIPNIKSAVIVSSHKSWLDIPILTLLTKRYIRYVAKKELFKSKVIEWYLNSTGVIAIDRDNPKSALNKIAKTIKNGDVVAIYPEGTRNKGEGIGKLNSGIAYVILKNNIYSPIYPVVITYQKGKFFGLPLRINIILGEKINPLDFSNQKDLMEEIYKSLSNLLIKLNIESA